MPDMTSDQIRDIAVRCVEGFFNDKVPLSVGLAKEASAFDMNLEQIKRASEVSNTVCQLKLMQLSEDKTIEFPLCKVAEVMAAICVPEAIEASSLNELSKQASFGPPSPEGMSHTVYNDLVLNDHERTVMFIKEASQSAKELSQLQDRAIILQSQLTKIASEVKADPAWLDKMSSISTPDFAMLSVLVSGSVSKPRDFGGHSMFKEAELKQVRTMAELYKEARQIVAESSKRQGLQKRASDLSSEMTKEAFLGAVAGGLGRAAGSVAGAIGKAGVGLATGAAHLGAQGFKGAFNIGKPGLGAVIGGTTVMESLGHLSSGGVGYAKNGAPKDVWEALQS